MLYTKAYVVLGSPIRQLVFYAELITDKAVTEIVYLGSLCTDVDLLALGEHFQNWGQIGAGWRFDRLYYLNDVRLYFGYSSMADSG